MMMHISKAGLDAIKRFEGLRLDAYRDSAGVLTIGYGHTGGVRDGDTISEQQADVMLMTDIGGAERDVRALVSVPLTQGQFDALVSWTFNFGGARLRDSTLLRKLNAGDYDAAATEFGRWIHAGGRVLSGLVKRRAEEEAMFRAAQTNAGGPAPATSAGAQQAPAAPLAPPPAPVVERSTIATTTPSLVKEPTTMPIPAFIAAAIPALVSAVPDLVRLFGSGGEVSERNAKVAEVAVDIVTRATGATNAQDAVERIQADPSIAEVARHEIRQQWFALEEIAGGIDAAREENAKSQPLPRTGLRFHELLTLLVVTGAYAIGGAYLFTGSPSPEMAAALVTALVISATGAVVAYWFGSTSGSAQKSELLAAKRPGQ